MTTTGAAPAVVDHVFGDGVTSAPARSHEYVPEIHRRRIHHPSDRRTVFATVNPPGSATSVFVTVNPTLVSAFAIVTDAGVICAGCQAWLPSGAVGGVSTSVHTCPTATRK